jgi:hypothetical protein
MFRRSVLLAVGALVAAAVAWSQPAAAFESGGRIRLGGFGGMGVFDQDDLNQTISDLDEFWDWWGDSWDYASFSGDELEGGPLFGAFAEYMLNEEWLVGAEFVRISSEGGFTEEYADYGDYPYYMRSDVDYEASGNLASVYGVYRRALGDSRFALRLGGGAGYVFDAALKLDSYSSDLEASGSAAEVHALAGAEYQAADQLMFTANVTYRWAPIDELVVDRLRPSDGWMMIEEGKPLRWYHEEDGGAFFSTHGDGHKVGLDFSGLYVTLGAAFTF